MTAAAVAAQLRSWERRLAQREPASVTNLRPGLSRAQVDALTADYDIRLPPDAAEVWMWHDGQLSDLGGPSPAMSMFPGGLFLSLRVTLEQSRTLEQITFDGDDDGDYSEEDELSAEHGRPVQIYFRHGFVLLSHDEYATYLDCTDPTVTSTPTARFSTWTDTPTPQLPLHERIAGWNRAWDAGVWPEAPHDWTTIDEHAAARLLGSTEPGARHRLR